jgi:hypothetical protein
MYMYVDINLLDIYLASSLSTLKICETLRKHRSSFDFFMNLPSCLALCFRQVYAGGVFAGTTMHRQCFTSFTSIEN